MAVHRSVRGLLLRCPECAATRTLDPHRGVLRFSSHDQRKKRAPQTGQRWVKRETAWEVVGEVRDLPHVRWKGWNAVGDFLRTLQFHELSQNRWFDQTGMS
jgi:hypothetical protein